MKKHLFILFIATSLCSLFIAPCSSFAQVPNYVPTNGLVGYWPFNGNANDESGNGNNGTTMNGANFGADRNGQLNCSAELTTDVTVPTPANVGQYILIPHNTNMSVTNFSISVWINPLVKNACIITKRNASDASSASFELTHEDEFQGQKGLSCSFSDNTCGLGGYAWSNQGIVPDSLWSHLVYVYTNSVVNQYLNGNLIYSFNSGMNSTACNNNTATLRIGGLHWNNDADWFKGKIDDIGIWNRALTQCEIQDLYHAQLNSAVGISAGPDQTVCEGAFITLNGSGGTNYVWNNSVVDGVPFIPTASMDYPVLGQDANGCIGTDTMHVELIPTSSSTLTETALDSYTLNGQTYTQSGTYTQVIPNAAGCDSTITLNLSLDFTGISELNKDFSIAPNPATNQLTISTSTLSNEKYILFDPQGRKVLSGTLIGTTTQLDLSKLARGNYLLQIGEKLTPVKLVKE